MNTALSTPSGEGILPVTEFLYLYRDAGNFKAHASILLRGRLSPDEMDRTIGAMEAAEFFVAEQVAIPPLYDVLFGINGGRTSSDHAWHSFVGFREVANEQQEGKLIWGSTTEFVEAFERVDEWNIGLSSNSW